MATLEGAVIEGCNAVNHMNGDMTHFRVVCPQKAFIVLHLVVHTKTEGSNCAKNERELEREVQISILFFTSGQSCVIVRLS